MKMPTKNLIFLNQEFYMAKSNFPFLTVIIGVKLRLFDVMQTFSHVIHTCFQEIMHDPHVAEDGFTYEKEALLGWLENGRETSPMTNLKLTHLHLTPNHSLRSAIQDWLCKS